MINLAFTLIPSLDPQTRRDVSQLELEDGFLRKLVLSVRQRIRYGRALYELHRLDDRDLDDIGIARIDFPELAWRHATGAELLTRPHH
jgi:uncharacterized protein YjiS (DUF1127 family)